MNAQYKGKQRLTGAEAMTCAVRLKLLIFISCHKTHIMTHLQGSQNCIIETLRLCIGPVVRKLVNFGHVLTLV